MSNESKTMGLLAGLFAIQMAMDPYGEYMDFGEIIDKGYEYNPEAEDVKFYMNMEIIKLLQEGYTEDEILEMIDKMNVEGFEELSVKNQNYVKEESKNLIRKRKENLCYE